MTCYSWKEMSVTDTSASTTMERLSAGFIISENSKASAAKNKYKCRNVTSFHPSFPCQTSPK